MSNTNDLAHGNTPGVETAAEAAASIERDFVDLIATLGRMIGNADGSEDQLRERMVKAKVAAQRGFSLSKQLSQLASRKPN